MRCVIYRLDTVLGLLARVESTGIGDSPPLAARRRGRRTALTFPDGPPPQKN